ncbi:MAG: hypothetical protein HYY20_02920, partial [Candidatus Tectomicrobia bacterium]|nr:hypothetical protein [Candidatus Tectomicrobia bacterium]
MTGIQWYGRVAAALILLVGLRGRSFAGEEGPGWLGKTLRDFNEAASSFDPAGHLLNPIEETVTDLYLKGMLRNRTMVDLHGHSDDLPNGKSKHYDLQFSEWLAELEIQYPLTRNISLVNIYNFSYDAAFDWEGGGRM